MTDLLDDIYQAIGDEGRWERLTRRLADGVTGEIAHHLEVARRAHEEHVRLTREVAALSAMHDQLAFGALIVDGDGRIIRSNAVGRRLLNDASGVVADEGVVRVVDPDDHAVLRNAIAEAASGRPRTVPFVLIRRPDQGPLAVFVVRPDTPGRGFFDDAPALLLLVVDPDLARAAGPQTLRFLRLHRARGGMRGPSDAGLHRGRGRARARRDASDGPDVSGTHGGQNRQSYAE